jgi:hypothetical protein
MFFTKEEEVDVYRYDPDMTSDCLPPKVYSIQFSDLRGFYLSIVDDVFTIPEKIYGNTIHRAERVIDAYLSRPLSTGVLLTGDKGSGKSLFMGVLGNKLIKEHNTPVVLIRDSFSGESFTSFLNSLGDVCVMIDEFAKIYGRHSDDTNQNHLLQILDGTDKIKRLFVLSENNSYDISEYLIGRPGRLHYHFKYSKLEKESIIDYCKDHDVDDKFTNEVVALSDKTRVFSFDVLQALVEEHKRSGECVDDLVDILNIEIFNMNAIVGTITKVYREFDNTPLDFYVEKIGDKDYATINPDNFYIRVKNTNNNVKELVTPVPENSGAEGMTPKGEDNYYWVEFGPGDLIHDAKDVKVYRNNGVVAVVKIHQHSTTIPFSLISAY